MERFTIKEYAERKAREAAAAITNDKMVRTVYENERSTQLDALGRAVATGERQAWELVGGTEYRAVGLDHVLVEELRRWLSGECVEFVTKPLQVTGRGVTRNISGSNQKIAIWVNAGWIYRLFVADESPDSRAGRQGAGRQTTSMEPPSNWSKGLKRVAWECARSIKNAGHDLTGPALYDAMACDDQVKACNGGLKYKQNNASLSAGEVSAKPVTIKKDWRKELDDLIR